MKTIKTAEATGVVLNWLVAKCVATVVKDGILKGVPLHGWWVAGLYANPNAWIKLEHWKPSTKWDQGGPIMDDAEIDTYLMERGSPLGWVAEITGTKFKGRGPTRLIAAMRCLVASKLGDEVDIPEELI